MRIAALILLASVAACGPAAASVDPAFEKAIAAFNPTERLTATAFYVKDCSEPANGSVTCDVCSAELIVQKAGEISVYAHTDTMELDGLPSAPHVARTVEQTSHNSHVDGAAGAKEAAKGAASFQIYLTDLYEGANAWCAAIGGTKHETKNVIPAVAHGKYVI